MIKFKKIEKKKIFEIFKNISHFINTKFIFDKFLIKNPKDLIEIFPNLEIVKKNQNSKIFQFFGIFLFFLEIDNIYFIDFIVNFESFEMEINLSDKIYSVQKSKFDSRNNFNDIFDEIENLLKA